MNENILITGGSGGIGSAIISEISDSRFMNLDLRSRQQLFENETFYSIDLTSEEQIHNFNNTTSIETITGYIHCAGFGGPFLTLDEVDESLWKKVFDININSAYLILKKLLPIWKKKSYGRFLAIASSQSIVGAKLSVPYSSSKHALVGFVKSIADEWGEFGITSNAISPGYIQTQMGIQESEKNGHLEEVLFKTPSKKIGSPEDIAKVAKLLMSRETTYVNGANWTVDGGITSI
ncbi:MAG: SDR family oxidoreductase [Leptospiraceae bacterium]|nr:SDR family oxidoreductase [Leptospiraceae bacterium]